MSCRSNALSRYVKDHVQLSPFHVHLPFLYQTTTLLGPAPKSCPNQSHGCLSSTPTRHIHSVPASHYRGDEQYNGGPSDGQSVRKSTITGSEQAIFDRIFKAIRESTGAQSSNLNRESYDGDDFDDELEPNFGPNESLQSIFNRAVKFSQKPIVQEANEALLDKREHYRDHYAPIPISFKTPRIVGYADKSEVSFRRPWLAKYGPTEAEWQFLEMDMENTTYRHVKLQQPDLDYTDHGGQFLPYRTIPLPRPNVDRSITLKGRAQFEEISSQLDSAQTDFDLWQLFEQQVFKKVEEMNKDRKREQRGKHATVKSKSTSEGANKAQSTPTEIDEGAVKKSRRALWMEVQSKSIVTPLRFLRTFYSPLCQQAMRLFRTEFPTSPYATALLTRIKDLGPMSYALGASKKLYNELLFIRWTHYFDIDGVAELVEEMIDSGVGTNELTLAVLRDGRIYRRKAADGRLGPIHKARLQLHGQRVSWDNWDRAWRRAWHAARSRRDHALMELEREWRELEEDEEAEDGQPDTAEQIVDHQVEEMVDGNAISGANGKGKGAREAMRKELLRRRATVEKDFRMLIS